MPSLVPADDLVTANGWIMSTNSAGQVLGPVVAGLLLAIVPVANLLFVDSATFLLSALALLRDPQELQRRRRASDAAEDRPRRAVRQVFRDVREGCATSCGHPVLRTISLMMAVINFVSAHARRPSSCSSPRSELAATDTEVGVLYAAGSAGIVVIGLVAGRDPPAAVVRGDRARRRSSCPGSRSRRSGSCGGTRPSLAALGVGQRVRAAAQHQHRCPAPSDRAAPHVRPGHQHRRVPGVVGHPARRLAGAK